MLTPPGLATPGAPLAHIFVGRYSLPVPLGLVLLAAVLVVALSFVLIYLAPPSLREGPDGGGRPISPWLGRGLSLLWTADLAFVVLAALFGRQDQFLFNPAVVLFWVWALPLLPLLHCLVGGLYPAANPFAAFTRALGGRALLPDAERIVKRLGYWPALLQLVVIVWGESVQSIVGSPHLLGLLALAYVVLQVAGGLLLGPGWYAGGDVFEATMRLAGTIAPVGLVRDAEGRLRFQAGFDAARSLPWRPGREALITLWLAGVLADGLRQLPLWKLTLMPALNGLVDALDNAVGSETSDTVTITVEIAVAWILFSYFFWLFVLVATRLSARPGERPLARRRIDLLAETVAPSLIPIAIAYLLAHNLTQLLVAGPFLWTGIGQPAAALGTLYQQQLRWISPGWVWWIQVAAIVAGHMLAVLLAHARLRAAFRAQAEKKPEGSRNPEAAALRADLGWLAAMLLYTATSLWIIAQPIT